MDIALIIIFMVIIGALIGGMTNFLAIKMLFRPYEAVYIGKYKLPFTPGLIPKRRTELAEQLGRVVTDYLVTSDALEQKVLDPQFQKKITNMVNQQIDHAEKNELTIEDVIRKINPQFNTGQLTSKIEYETTNKIRSIYNEYKHETIKELLPKEVEKGIETRLPEVTTYILEQIEQYLTSEEGQQKISDSASKFLQTQGFLGNMVSSYLGENGLAEKITPAIQMFLSSEETQQSIERLLNQEWKKFQSKDLSTIREFVGDVSIEEHLAKVITDEIKLEDYLQKPIGELFNQYLSKLKEEWVPRMIELLFNQLSSQMTSLLEQLNLNDLVEKEVETFEVSRIESLVLEITKREMNMITYLGALLGGLIGVIQGIFVLILT